MTSVTDAQGDFVLTAIAEQGWPLRRACRAAGCPTSSFWDWQNADPSRRERYARAREAQIRVWAGEIVEIADDNVRDVYETEEGRTIVDHDHIQRAKLRVDSRRWLLSKLALYEQTGATWPASSPQPNASKPN
jgi:hypothetical protein